MGWPALENPAPDAAAALLADALHRSLVMVVATCTVAYDGRASSTLPAGQRLILLKKDGSLVVHQATGLKPVNWQPPGASFTLEATGDGLTLLAQRHAPRETVRIHCQEIRLVAAIPADDEALELAGTESDLVDALEARPHLIEPGLRLLGREVDRARGPIDLYAIDAASRRVVIEVKRRAATLQDAIQLARYVERERGLDARTRGLLVSPRISPRAHRLLLEHGLEHVRLDPERARATARDATARQARLTDDGGAPVSTGPGRTRPPSPRP